jgi:vacuolar-type H+-ATPase subunit I/STV1
LSRLNWHPVVDLEIRAIEQEQMQQLLEIDDERLRQEDERMRKVDEQRRQEDERMRKVDEQRRKVDEQRRKDDERLAELDARLFAIVSGSSTSSSPVEPIPDRSEM